ncbi:Fic/DOC family protein [Fundicoccus sp. Sow4_H7]|uniref:Fic/DOC family protein n=1 Tax=Fundicoccus sp. Sow4_H7 TaxID=3438784 RepID=UPI003F8F1A70
MKRNNRDYPDYQYDDPGLIYVYSDSGVLRNKFSIRNEEELELVEREITNQRLIELYIQPIKIHTMEDVKLIHRFLFESIYEWAGDYRAVDIGKGHHMFMPLSRLEQGENYINSLLAHITTISNNRSELIKSLVEILDNLNHLHPFREGNGRTQREAIRSLALDKGYRMDFDLSDADNYKLYMNGLVDDRLDLLEELFDKLMVECNE